MFADEGIIKVKHKTLYYVAKHAFAGDLEEKEDFIPYEITPGPRSSIRCCIYKEREITRQRIRLAKGLATSPVDNGNVMQVISAACEDCPISSYVVTENCQNCAGKACYNSCQFGAIQLGRRKTYIDPAKCKECGKCANACPYNAIAALKRPCKNSCPVDAITYDENGISVIDDDKCIRCGRCIHKCPFGAIGSRAFIVDVINAIKSDKKVYALIAPAAEGQFGEDVNINSWKKAMKALGFDDAVEVAIGADMTAEAEALEWAEAFEQGIKKTTSCCPAFVNMIEKHFPEILENMSTTVSPMCAVSRMIKAKEPDAVCVFIGPCIAKKSEVYEHNIEGNADFVLTYSEVRAMMKAKEIALEPDDYTTQEGSKYGKRFANAGGVTAAVLQSLKEVDKCMENASVHQCSGAADCKKALLLLKVGRLEEDFIEGMICEGGCVGGPSSYKDMNATRKQRDAIIAKADDRDVHDTLKDYDMDSFSMHRNNHK